MRPFVVGRLMTGQVSWLSHASRNALISAAT